MLSDGETRLFSDYLDQCGVDDVISAGGSYMIKGYAGRILEIDLAARSHAFKPLDEDCARLYLGVKGYATRLLYDTCAC
jgi:hypothetical protein